MVEALRLLGAERPNGGMSVAGGVYRRILIGVPAIGKGSAPQNIPKGIPAKNAVHDRQFTDQNCGPVVSGGKQAASVRMRRRSCHFCPGCRQLEPMDPAHQGKGRCGYEDHCGNPDNVVEIMKDPSMKGMQITNANVGNKLRAAAAKDAAVGEIVAVHAKSESEPWFLGRVLKAVFTANCSFPGTRGERVQDGAEYLFLQKVEDAIGAGSSYYWEIDGEEGQIYVPAENLIVRDVQLVSKPMTKNEAKEAMGEEWGDLSPGETRDILTPSYMYLPESECERVWMNAPH